MDVPRSRYSRRLLLVGVPTFLLAAAGYFHLSGGRFVTTENAYVKAHIVRLSPKIAGTVAEVLVADNQHVTKGDVLFRLDDRSLRLDHAVAAAELAAVQRKVSTLKAKVRQEQTEIESAEERIRFFTGEFARQKKLKKKGIGGGAKYETAEHDLNMARRSLGSLRERINVALSELGGNIETPVDQHPLVRQAAARLDRVALDLDHTVVRAPMSGVLSNVTLQPGERVAAGKPLFALVSADRYWVQANLKEVHLTNVRVEQRATVVLDAYPSVEWQGTVESISPATGAEFSLLPAQNATGNWVKVVQRIPVRIRIEIPENAPALRVGMTATVSIDTGADHATVAVADESSDHKTDGKSTD